MVRTITTLVSSATFKTSLNPLFYLPQVWEGEGVIKYGRKLIGATDPQKSEPGTIRGDLAVVVGRYNLELFVFRLLNPCYLKFQLVKWAVRLLCCHHPVFRFATQKYHSWKWWSGDCERRDQPVVPTGGAGHLHKQCGEVDLWCQLIQVFSAFQYIPAMLVPQLKSRIKLFHWGWADICFAQTVGEMKISSIITSFLVSVT